MPLVDLIYWWFFTSSTAFLEAAFDMHLTVIGIAFVFGGPSHALFVSSSRCNSPLRASGDFVFHMSLYFMKALHFCFQALVIPVHSKHCQVSRYSSSVVPESEMSSLPPRSPRQDSDNWTKLGHRQRTAICSFVLVFHVRIHVHPPPRLSY